MKCQCNHPFVSNAFIQWEYLIRSWKRLASYAVSFGKQWIPQKHFDLLTACQDVIRIHYQTKLVPICKHVKWLFIMYMHILFNSSIPPVHQLYLTTNISSYERIEKHLTVVCVTCKQNRNALIAFLLSRYWHDRRSCKEMAPVNWCFT